MFSFHSPCRVPRSTKSRTSRAVSRGFESLEHRQLLSADGLSGLSQLQVDPTSYHPSRFLVQFRDASAAGLERVDLAEGQTLADAMVAYAGRNDVLYVEPDFRVEIAMTPNDPSFGDLWGLHNSGQNGGTLDADIDAREAWQYTTGSPNIIVAVMDTGVDYTHPDLAANIWTNTAEVPGNYQDDDGNGYIDDVRGWDFVNRDNNPLDDHGHGTHVAGTIAATGNNSVGVIGVAPGVKIMPLKFLDETGSGFASDAVAALNYAIDNGAQISNHSWGVPVSSQALADAVLRAALNNHLVVAAAGNGEFWQDRFAGGTSTDYEPNYPSNYVVGPDSLISVTASDRHDEYPWFANFGKSSVDLAAPGAEILSTVPTTGELSDPSGYALASGSSMATPHVSGAAALVWSVNPDLTALEVKNLLLSTTESIADPIWQTVTDGRLNVKRAIIAALPVEPQYVTQNGRAVTVTGSDDLDDTFKFSVDAGRNMLVLEINGQTHEFRRAAVDTVSFTGGAGNDTATVLGTAADNTARLSPESGWLKDGALTVSVVDAETITFMGGGGYDIVERMSGANGGNELTARPFDVTILAKDPAGALVYKNSAIEFEQVYAYALGGGRDKAVFEGSHADDLFTARAYIDDAFMGPLAEMQSQVDRPAWYNRVKGFEEVRATAGFGADMATFKDSAGADRFEGRPDTSRLYSVANTYEYRADQFEQVHAYAMSGRKIWNDQAELFGTAADGDRFVADSGSRYAYMKGVNYLVRAKFFGQVRGDGLGGVDDGKFLSDPSGSGDLLEAGSDDTTGTPWARLSSIQPNIVYELVGADSVRAYSKNTNDVKQIDAAVDWLLTYGAWK